MKKTIELLILHVLYLKGVQVFGESWILMNNLIQVSREDFAAKERNTQITAAIDIQDRKAAHLICDEICVDIQLRQAALQICVTPHAAAVMQVISYLRSDIDQPCDGEN